MNRSDKYDVFISYSRRDYVDENKNLIPNNIISEIKNALKKAEISYWFDEDGIYCGDAWAEKIAEQIDECSVFLFISSINSNKAEWTRKEISTAHMFKKKIIPFRLDDSVYHKSVIIYLSDLDFIDYYTNPSLALTRLVDSISKYLKDKKKAAEKLLEKKRKEEDEAKMLANAEQKALITDIETACSDIDDYELKSEHSRKKATSKIKRVKSAEQRARLTALIQSSGSISSENFSLKEAKKSLTEENSSLKDEIKTETERFKTLYKGYKSIEEEKNNLATVIAKLRASLFEEERKNSDISKSLRKANAEIKANNHRHQNEIEENNIKHKKEVEDLNFSSKTKLLTSIALSVLLIILCSVFIYLYRAENQSVIYYYNKYWELDVINDKISDITPLIITDVKIGNIYNGGEIETAYGEDIYESNTMYITPLITYIGLKDVKNIELGVKWFKPDGTPRRGDSSPENYTYITKTSISAGNDKSLELSGWGNENKGHYWKTGTYKIEIWHNDRCLISKEFTIKAGNPPESGKIGKLD